MDYNVRQLLSHIHDDITLGKHTLHTRVVYKYAWNEMRLMINAMSDVTTTTLKDAGCSKNTGSQVTRKHDNIANNIFKTGQ